MRMGIVCCMRRVVGGNLEGAVRKLVEEEGIEVGVRGRRGRGVFWGCVEGMGKDINGGERGNREVLRYLIGELKKKGEVGMLDERDADGLVVVVEAAKLGKRGIVAELVSGGVDLERGEERIEKRIREEKKERSALYAGVSGGYQGVVMELLKGGAEVDRYVGDYERERENESGDGWGIVKKRTALWKAVKMGRVGLVRMLVEFGAQGDKECLERGGERKTIIEMARERLKKIKLVKAKDVNNGGSWMAKVAEKKYLTIVGILEGGTKN